MSESRADRDSVRARAGTLLTATSLITSFLGGLALTRYHDTHPHSGLTVLAWSAIGAFIVVVLSAVVILLPWPWTFILSPTILVEDHLEGERRTEPDELREFLSLILEGHQEQNGRAIARLLGVFSIGCGFLVYEAVVWIWILGGG